MAIKPPAHPTTRATNANYAGGLRPGTPTTGAHPNPADGWQVGQKPPSQAQNTYDKSTDLHAAWVDEGSSDALLEAHIKETDADGKTNVACIEAGNTASDAYSVIITPNSGAAASGLICSTGSSKHGAICRQQDRTVSAMILQSNVASGASGVGALRVENTVTNGTSLITVSADSDDETAIVMTQSGYASLIQTTAGAGVSGVADGQAGLLCLAGAPDGANTGGPAARFTSVYASGSIVEIENANGAADGICLDVTGQNRARPIVATQLGGREPAIYAAASEVGGDASAPIRLAPQTFDTSGEGFVDGSIYVKELDIGGADTHVPKIVLGNTTRSLMTSRGPMCGIYHNVSESPAVAITPSGSFEVIDTVSFLSKYEPVDAGPVHISFKFTAKRASATSEHEYIQIRVVDETESPDVVVDIQTLELAPPSATAAWNALGHHLEFRARYTLPGAGARTFRIEGGASSGEVGNIGLSRMLFEVRPVWV